ncbi:MAG: phosphate transport system regulatory protein PhoU [Alteromonadaceae bacterium]|nr:phosphate transport system regulatory protein PhoU [Alteromonadaceae bacterium]MDA0892535.1 phosphate signaling complex protein PhoU [Pseudomonadota bacterium]RPH11043.1 MAG: phosphate signaling complex protein PhoU [Alteromonadaceae bacterium TMED101]CAI8316506.1 MAG: Phosphate-specific transport system accessory protein PhoU [Halieaceae bacterium]HBQ03173.1 phosphate transport system regulatory protein PhoU [Halieaceae bacterium]|tara:strand:- start:2567 stop:3280 length:714 start_codon:yes stop_codon:yes gene_type:complete
MTDQSHQRIHISAQFSRELEGVRDDVLTMGGTVESQITKALDALLDGNSELAEQVIALDSNVNELERSISDQCMRILALRQPAAGDLRLVLAVIKVTTDLERIGDEAAKMGRQAVLLSEIGVQEKIAAQVRDVAVRSITMVKNALDSFARLEVGDALSVILSDDDTDEAYANAREWLLLFAEENPASLRVAMSYLWILKGLERIGDHAANIAEQVIFLTEGVDVRHLDSQNTRDLLS